MNINDVKSDELKLPPLTYVKIIKYILRMTF